MTRLSHLALGAILPALLLLQAPGVAEALEAAACDDCCPDGDEPERCPPDCADCTCCSHARSVEPPAPPIAHLPPAAPATLVESAERPQGVDPGRIDHVPKRPRA